MNSSRIELLWLVWDQSQSKYYLRTKFHDGIDKSQKCRNVCYHPTHQQQSDFLILVLYDFIVQNILSSSELQIKKNSCQTLGPASKRVLPDLLSSSQRLTGTCVQ
jgi:hypothetical protein